jgi:3-oxoacyl-[acyl-carrier protein] reductase
LNSAAENPSQSRQTLHNVSTFGRLDVLVNNASTAIPKPFEDATLEELDRHQRPRRIRQHVGGTET